MKRDWLLIAAITLVITIGLTTLFSTVVGEDNILFGGGVFNKQLIFVIVGYAIFHLISNFNYRLLQHYQIYGVLYIVTIILLVFLLFWGKEINGSKRWIFFGDFQFQVSEFAKIIVIIISSSIMTHTDKVNPYKLAGLSLFLTLIIAVLVFLEPDAGTSLLILISWFFITITSLPNQTQNILLLVIISCAGVGVNYLMNNSLVVGFGILSIPIIFIIFSYIKDIGIKNFAVYATIFGIVLGVFANYTWNNILLDYQKQRILTFINPNEDIQGAGFQVAQSKVAIGSGMIFGKGFGHGTQSKLNFLPEHQTDFIFATFAEEFGLIGSLFVIFLYGFIIYRILTISNLSSDKFGKILCIGIAIKILLEVYINIGMNLGVVPATGVPLPLMSAGGSIFIMTMLAIGLVQGVYVNRNEL